MARIAGVNIPTDKRVHIALTYIHGIGNTKAKEITTALGIDEMSRVNQLSDDQVVAIREKIDADYLVEGELRTQVRMHIKRHRRKLPVRGQRTRCNARARKGKAVAIAGKKK